MKRKLRYPGTKPFSEEDKDLFKGREFYINKLYDMLKAKDMIVFYGESGIGKSSLINAGLIPLFRTTDENLKYLPVKIRLGAKDILGTEDNAILLTKILTQLQEQLRKNLTQTISIFDPAQEDLWHITKILQKSGYSLLLIIDQAEELFTYGSDKLKVLKKELYTLFSNYLPKYLDEKIEKLLEKKVKEYDGEIKVDSPNLADLGLLHANLNAKVLFVVREDKLGMFEFFSDFFPDILKNTFKIKPFERDDAIEAIELPAAIEGVFDSPAFTFDDGGLDALLEILKEEDDTFDPFSIQLNCSYIERDIVSQDKTNVTREDIPEKGLVEKEFFNNVWKAIPEHLKDRIPEFKKNVANKFIDSLNERRIRAYQKDLFESPIVDALIEEGLIRRGKENDVAYYELNHDRLVKPILEHEKQRILEEDAVIIAKQYDRLLRELKEMDGFNEEQQNALQVLIEEHLITSRKRNLIEYDLTRSDNLINPSFIKFLITRKFLNIDASDNLEISSDGYVESILKKRDIRLVEEQKKAAEEKLSRVKLRRTIMVVAILLTSIAIILTIYSNLSDRSDSLQARNKTDRVKIKADSSIIQRDSLKADKYSEEAADYALSTGDTAKAISILKDVTKVYGASKSLNKLIGIFEEKQIPAYRVDIFYGVRGDSAFSNVEKIAQMIANEISKVDNLIPRVRYISASKQSQLEFRNRRNEIRFDNQEEQKIAIALISRFNQNSFFKNKISFTAVFISNSRSDDYLSIFLKNPETTLPLR